MRTYNSDCTKTNLYIKCNIHYLSTLWKLHTYMVDELNSKGIQNHVNWFAGTIHHPVTSTSHVKRNRGTEEHITHDTSHRTEEQSNRGRRHTPHVIRHSSLVTRQASRVTRPHQRLTIKQNESINSSEMQSM